MVHGGPGTYNTVNEQSAKGNPVLLVKESGGCAQQLADFIVLLKAEAVGERGDKSKVDFWRPLVAKLAPNYRDKLGKAGQDDKFFNQFMEIAERVPLMHVYSALEEKRNSFESMLLNSFVSAYQRTANEDKRVRELQMLVKKLGEVTEGEPAPHIKARSQDNPKYPIRLAVPDDKLKWEVEWPEYEPTRWTAAHVIANARDLPDRIRGKNDWADPADVDSLRDELQKRETFTKRGGFLKEKAKDVLYHSILFDEVSGGGGTWRSSAPSTAAGFAGSNAQRSQYLEKKSRYHNGPATNAPLNPRGRTGMQGRGALGKWGPNHAADPIVTRWHTDESGRRRLQMVAIRRADNGQWAIPGGMVDAGEEVSVTLKREFKEEAGSMDDPAEQEQFNRLHEELFKNGLPVYTGYVDDPRNTDNAWMETSCDALPLQGRARRAVEAPGRRRRDKGDVARHRSEEGAKIRRSLRIA